LISVPEATQLDLHGHGPTQLVDKELVVLVLIGKHTQDHAATQPIDEQFNDSERDVSVSEQLQCLSEQLVLSRFGFRLRSKVLGARNPYQLTWLLARIIQPAGVLMWASQDRANRKPTLARCNNLGALGEFRLVA
jgi:hypothetical protein